MLTTTPPYHTYIPFCYLLSYYVSKNTPGSSLYLQPTKSEDLIFLKNKTPQSVFLSSCQNTVRHAPDHLPADRAEMVRYQPKHSAQLQQKQCNTQLHGALPPCDYSTRKNAARVPHS